MKQPEAFIIISRFNEDPSWIKKYTKNYIIYNKGSNLDDSYNVKKMPNIGGNQYDIAHFIYENYENLPDLMAFVQADPWDHCKKEKFDEIIYNEHFTAIESYEHVDTSEGSWMKLDKEGGFMEINNSWYISAHNSTYNQSCIYNSLDEFMQSTFINYKRQEWVRFSPGSQYIVEKKLALNYSKIFWSYIMSVIAKYNTTEAHIIERCLMMIFSGHYSARVDLK